MFIKWFPRTYSFFCHYFGIFWDFPGYRSSLTLLSWDKRSLNFKAIFTSTKLPKGFVRINGEKLIEIKKSFLLIFSFLNLNFYFCKPSSWKTFAFDDKFNWHLWKCLYWTLLIGIIDLSCFWKFCTLNTFSSLLLILSDWNHSFWWAKSIFGDHRKNLR